MVLFLYLGTVREKVLTLLGQRVQHILVVDSIILPNVPGSRAYVKYEASGRRTGVVHAFSEVSQEAKK